MINERTTATRAPNGTPITVGGRGSKPWRSLGAPTATGCMRRNFFRDSEIFDRKSKNEGKTPSFKRQKCLRRSD
jgi:hypothetical protein